MECKAANLLSLFNVIDVDVSTSLGVLGSFTNGKVPTIDCHGHAGELDSRVAEDRLLSSFCVFNHELVVQGEIGEASLRVPHEIVMDSSISVVSSDELLLKDVSLALDSLLVFKVRLDCLSTAKEVSVGQLPVVSDLCHIVG